MSSLKITKMIVPSSKYSIKCPNKMTVEGITIHNTYNDASAKSEISYMIGNNNQTSYYAAIDDKGVVIGLPANRNGWHAGDGKNGFGNRKTLGLEICYSKSGGSKFDKAERNAAIFIAQLMKTYGFKKSDIGTKVINTHKYRSGKYCPHRTLDRGISRFYDMIKKEYDNLNIDKPSSPGTPVKNNNKLVDVKNYMVEIKQTLSIRKDAGAGYDKVGSYKAGDQVTITHTKMSKDGKTKWGKTKKGYISLSSKYSSVMKGVTDVKNYKVKTKTVLNYRKKAGTSNKKLGAYKKGAVVTITHHKTVDGNVWGKTSKGWINLNKKYVKKG